MKRKKKSRRYTSKRTMKTGKKKTVGYVVNISFIDILEGLLEPKSKKKRKR